MTRVENPRDRLVQILSTWSGRPASEHQGDADLIFGTLLLKLRGPTEVEKRAERIRRAAEDIKRAISEMSRGVEQSTFNAAFQKAMALGRGEPDRLADCIAALAAAAMTLKNVAEADLDGLPHWKNLNRSNVEIAMVVAEIYFREAGKEPPRGGDTGPLQNLLRELYAALGRPDVDLRGPLQKVHEFRKN